MAPSNDKDPSESSRRISTDSFDNPLTAFHRFVDEQMSSMLQSLVGLPSALTHSRNWPKEAWQKQSEEDPASPPVPPHLPTSAPTGEELVSHFLNESPYSPFNVENDPDLKVFGSLWLHAFGDLMDATEGRRMTSSIRELNRAEWVAHYVPRWSKMAEEKMMTPHPAATLFGAVRPMVVDVLGELKALKTAFEDEGRGIMTRREKEGLEEREKEWDGEPETELDMYERMLGLGNEEASEPRSQNQSPSAATLPSVSSSQTPVISPRQQPQPSPSLISTLTTTERVTMPDGSVRTKRVLRKRFADGSEESNESEEVQAPRQKPTGGLLEDAWKRAPNEEKQENEKREEKKKGGWFWS